MLQRIDLALQDLIKKAKTSGKLTYEEVERTSSR